MVVVVMESRYASPLSALRALTPDVSLFALGSWTVLVDDLQLIQSNITGNISNIFSQNLLCF